MSGPGSQAAGGATLFQYELKRTLVGKLDYGSDLLTSVEDFCKKEGIKLGLFTALGAVTQAAFSFYDQRGKVYKDKIVEEELEIASCSGNISLREGEPVAHAHLVFSDGDGRTCGGHLIKGTRVFSCELVIHELRGEQLTRAYDDRTGLHLWRMQT